MNQYTGWLFDIYAHPDKGVVLWLIGQDGKPHCFHQNFEITFYAAGTAPRLRELWGFLRDREVKLARTQKEDLFAGPQDVMEIRVASASTYPELFREVSERFSGLTFYDADISLTLRFIAAHNVFMMACCEVTAEPDGKLVAMHTLDTPSELDPPLPHFRKLSLKPDVDPSHGTPAEILIKYCGFSLHAPLNQPHLLLGLLNHILSQYDPDVILTQFGDTWLFPRLEKLAEETGLLFNPNRDHTVPVLHRAEVSFFNYGRAHYRGPQVHLRGRWHIDSKNCMVYGDYGLMGTIEQTRMTGLPAQEGARRSPGAAIAALQMLTAMQRGVLVPYQHQQGEIPKTYNQLIKADRGGLVLQPPVGVFPNVAILDFSSLMASIMIEWNVSPETVGEDDETALDLPELGIQIGGRLGLMPCALRALRDKRLALKHLLTKLDSTDPHCSDMHRRYKSVVDALKWLTVVAYGRLGFANSTFGRINSHEVVSYLARKAITQAKVIAEANGYRVLHLYVDSLFISRPNTPAADFRNLADEIERETHLPIELQKIYPWFAFISSRENPNVSVANRFYGLSPDGDHKVRGLALRRRDTPAFMADTQRQILEILAKESDPEKLADLLPEILDAARERMSELSQRKVPLQKLVVTQTLSRELKEYTYFSHIAIAAKELQAQGKVMQRGQQVRFIYVSPGPGVRAWDLPQKPDPRRLDVIRYKELLLRAVHEVLQPLGVTEQVLRDWLFSKAGYLALPGLINSSEDWRRLESPLFAFTDEFRQRTKILT